MFDFVMATVELSDMGIDVAVGLTGWRLCDPQRAAESDTGTVRRHG